MMHDTTSDWRSERRHRILAAAKELFSQAAFDSVQMDAIARTAGIGKPTLYRYFASKEELFLEVFKEALRELERQVEAALAEETSPPRLLARMIRAAVSVLGGQVGALRLLTGDHPDLIVRWRSEFRQRRRPIMDAFRSAIERGMAEGSFRAVDLEAVPAMLVGMVRGGLMGADRVGRDRLADAAVDLVLGGLLQPEAAGRAGDIAPAP